MLEAAGSHSKGGSSSSSRLHSEGGSSILHSKGGSRIHSRTVPAAAADHDGRSLRDVAELHGAFDRAVSTLSAEVLDVVTLAPGQIIEQHNRSVVLQSPPRFEIYEVAPCHGNTHQSQLRVKSLLCRVIRMGTKEQITLGVHALHGDRRRPDLDAVDEQEELSLLASHSNVTPLFGMLQHAFLAS